MVVLELFEKDLCLLCFRSCCVKRVLYLAELSSNLKVLFFELGFVVSQVLNDSVQLLGLSFTDVNTLELLNIML